MSYSFDSAEKLGGSFNPTFAFKKKGDKIVGILVGNKHGVGQFKKEVWTIKTDDGDVDIWGCTSLDRNLENLTLRRNAVEVTYDGDGEATKGNPPHLFTVRVVGVDDQGKQIPGAGAVYKGQEDEGLTEEEQTEQDAAISDEDIDESL